VIVLRDRPGDRRAGIRDRRANGHLRAVDHGCLTTTSDQPLPERLVMIHALRARPIELHRPDVLAIERVFFSRNVQTALAVGHARGVVLWPPPKRACRSVRRHVRGPSPQWPVTRADKEQVARMVQLILTMPEPPTPDDAADALASRSGPPTACDPASAPRRRSLDRAAVAPLARGQTPYERAVRRGAARRGASSRSRRAAG